MNTRIGYLYRDADNYKIHHDEVLRGEITQQQLATIVSCLDSGEYFIPHQVGLPDTRFDSITDSDHPWFELNPGWDFESTSDEPTIEMTVDELVALFQAAKDNWDAEILLSDEPAVQETENASSQDEQSKTEVCLFVVEGGVTNAGLAHQAYVFRIAKNEAETMANIAIQRGISKVNIHVFPLKGDLLD